MPHGGTANYQHPRHPRLIALLTHKPTLRPMRLLVKPKRTLLVVVLFSLLAIAASACQVDDCDTTTHCYAYGPCGFGTSHAETGRRQENVLTWTPGGSQLVVSHEEVIWIVDATGEDLRRIVDANPGHERFLSYGLHAAVAPDSSSIAYTVCKYGPEDTKYTGRDFGLGYEIEIVGLDGNNPRSLTKNTGFDNFAVWSPDGSQIVFIGSNYGINPVSLSQICLVSADGSQSEDDEHDVNPCGQGTALPVQWMNHKVPEPLIREVLYGVALFPPAWSPDGDVLAFLAYEDPYYGAYSAYWISVGRLSTPILYAVRTDGSDLARIGQATAPPTMSPDGQKMAFANSDETGTTIYSVRFDGGERRTLWNSGVEGYAEPISQVSWSPRGSEILFISEHTYLVDSDGNDPRRLKGIPADYDGVRPAAWSPDGSRIAIYSPDSGLITISPDGTDLRVLLEVDDDEFRPLAPTPLNATTESLER